jgi:RsiW-degrading membrane proteinase PrsW (M82 family)
MAVGGGVLPALLWLWFWLQEDSKRPEPRRRIAAAFLGGMVAVILALPLERETQSLAGANSFLLVFLLWAVIEEVLKLFFAFITTLSKRDMDEPIDGLIYLITTALGFAALESVLFLFTPLQHGLLFQGFITGNLRFIGAMVLHTLTSGLIGLSIALSFYRRPWAKFYYLLIGLAVAVILHTLFNFFIMTSDQSYVFLVFSFVWLAVVLLILSFEKVKTLRPFNK